MVIGSRFDVHARVPNRLPIRFLVFMESLRNVSGTRESRQL